MKEFSLQITASTVAWYGAIVATLALAINLASFFYKLWQDSERVKLKIMPNMRMFPSLPPHPADTDFVVYVAINKGLRAITITMAGFKYKKGKKKGAQNAIIIPNGPASVVGALPKEIKPGDNHGVYALQSEIIKDIDIIDSFYVITATDKVIRTKMTRSLRKRFRG